MLMTNEISPHIQIIQDCEAAIGRIRAAIRAGIGGGEAAGEEWERIRRAVEARFVRYARSLRAMGPVAVEEALDALYDRLLDDIWNLNYSSLEWGFGAYLKTVPLRVLERTARNHRAPGASYLVEHLDDMVMEDGMSRHEMIEDERAEQPFGAIGDQEELRTAIERLPAPERQVIALRLHEVENNVIASRLGVAPATATRIYQRAVTLLQASLNPPDEGETMHG